MASRILPAEPSTSSSNTLRACPVRPRSPTGNPEKGNPGKGADRKPCHPLGSSHAQRGQQMVDAAPKSMSDSQNHVSSVTADAVYEALRANDESNLATAKERQRLIQQAQKSLLQSKKTFDPVKATLLLAKCQNSYGSSSISSSLHRKSRSDSLSAVSSVGTTRLWPMAVSGTRPLSASARGRSSTSAVRFGFAV